jgi:hypothetical protein
VGDFAHENNLELVVGSYWRVYSLELVYILRACSLFGVARKKSPPRTAFKVYTVGTVWGLADSGGRRENLKRDHVPRAERQLRDFTGADVY